MPHPKKRRTTSDKGKRRSHHALKTVAVAICKECGKAVKPHHACPACGSYDGKSTLKKKVAPNKVEAKKTTKKVAPKKTVKKEESSNKETK